MAKQKSAEARAALEALKKKPVSKNGTPAPEEMSYKPPKGKPRGSG